MSSEDLLWRLVIPTVVVVQLLAFALAWKRLYKFAGFAVSLTPALLLYSIYLLNAGSGDLGVKTTFDLVLIVALLVPLLIGVLYFLGVRLPAYPLWIAWAINMLPCAFLIYMVCCFRIQF